MAQRARVRACGVSVRCGRGAGANGGVGSATDRRAAEKCRASRGVCVAKRASSCMTYAICRRNLGSLGFTFRPSAVTEPPTLRLPLLPSRPARMLRRVDLPAPLGPIIAQIPPGAMEPDTPLTIFLSPTSKVMFSHPRTRPAGRLGPVFGGSSTLAMEVDGVAEAWAVLVVCR